MVLKVSINLPGSVEITCEASDPTLCTQVLGLVLKDLPRDLIQIRLSESSTAALPESPEPAAKELAGDAEQSGQAENRLAVPEVTPTDAEEQFAKYCRDAAPVGDMRRVVVASWAGRRFLGTNSISDKELGYLFTLVGWRQPDSFTQTLRNAARSKFRWLERIPGRAGYYSLTDIGIQTVVPNPDC